MGGSPEQPSHLACRPQPKQFPELGPVGALSIQRERHLPAGLLCRHTNPSGARERQAQRRLKVLGGEPRIGR